MCKIITVINQKGGVGKSTTVAALGGAIMLKGKKVLFVDLDPQGNLSYALGAEGSHITSIEVLTGTNTAAEAVVHTEQGDIIPAAASLGCASSLLPLEKPSSHHRLENALKPLKDNYDFILIDTPPATGVLHLNALIASTAVLIPVEASAFSVQGVASLYVDTIEEVRQYGGNPDLKVLGLVLTRYSGKANVSKAMKKQLEEAAGMMQSRLFNTVIRECAAVKDAQAAQQSIYTRSPRSNAVKDYTALLDEVLKVKF